jgi:hypothetical protein
MILRSLGKAEKVANWMFAAVTGRLTISHKTVFGRWPAVWPNGITETILD